MARGKTFEPVASASRKSPLSNDLMVLKQSEALFEIFAKALPSRVSIRQAFAFLIIAEREAAGHETIVSDLRNLEITDAWGKPVFDASIGRSYQLFTDEPSKDYPEPMGWMRLEADPQDKRRKLLRLTAKGEAFVRQIVKARNASQKPPG